MSTTLDLFAANLVELGAEPDRDAWCSPVEVRDCLLAFTGGEPVDLDPCTNSRSIIPARVGWTRADAVTAAPIRPWHGTVWCNWPFSTPEEWARACREEAELGHCTWVLGLGICDPSVRWWRHMWQADAICFPDHRLHFDPPPGAASSSNTHASAIALWLPPPRADSWRGRSITIDRFRSAFGPLGHVERIG